MYERPPKLAPLAVLVVWTSHRLTLGEKAVWYRDWTLDQGEGCYAGAKGLSEALGGNLTPGTVETVRQRLKRLGLHQAMARPEGRNVGWIATLPDSCARPRSAKEAAAMAFLLDRQIEESDRGPMLQGRTQVLDKENPGSTSTTEGVSGGVGGAPFSKRSETPLPSAVEKRGEKGGEKRVGSHEPTTEKRGNEPAPIGDILRRRAAGGSAP